MTRILTKTGSFHAGEEQGLAIDVALFIHGLLSDESDEISWHQEWVERLEVVDWPRRRAISSGRYFHSSISFVWPYRISHGVGPLDLEFGWYWP